MARYATSMKDEERQARGLYNYSRLENIRTNLIFNKRKFDPKWRDSASIVAPYRYRRSPENTNDGGRKDRRIRRNTAGRSLRTFVSGMQNGNTPRSRPWFRLSTLDEKISFDKRRTLSEQTEIIDRFLHISNFYQVMPGVYKDLGVFSNACFAMLPHPRNVFQFYPISVGQYAIGAGQDGKVNSFVRDYSLTVRQVVEKFGKVKDNGHIDWENSLNDWIQQMWNNAQYEQEIVLTNVIIPNQNAKKNPIDPLDRNYLSYTYINRWGAGSSVPQHWPNARNVRLGQYGGGLTNATDAKADGRDDFILEISGYDYFPIIAVRWEQIPDEAYGVGGPMELAHADILTLQKEQEYRLEAVAKLVRPPFIGPASLAGYRLSTAAGGINYFNEMSDKQLRPLYEIDPKLSELINSMEEADQFIKEAFYVDLFMLLSQNDPKSHVSAAEIQKRSAEGLQLISPVLSQFDDDCNEPVIRNAYYLLHQRGLMPELPEELGAPIVPEYISTLAQATKINQAATMDRFMNFVTTSADALGENKMKYIIDPIKFARKYANVIGIDPAVERSDDEIEEKHQADMEVAQQQAQQEQMLQQAQAAKDMSQAKLEGNSMLDRVEQQQQEQGGFEEDAYAA